MSKRMTLRTVNCLTISWTWLFLCLLWHTLRTILHNDRDAILVFCQSDVITSLVFHLIFEELLIEILAGSDIDIVDIWQIWYGWNIMQLWHDKNSLKCMLARVRSMLWQSLVLLVLADLRVMLNMLRLRIASV